LPFQFLIDVEKLNGHQNAGGGFLGAFRGKETPKARGQNITASAS
jgi:hypothetical protein